MIGGNHRFWRFVWSQRTVSFPSFSFEFGQNNLYSGGLKTFPLWNCQPKIETIGGRLEILVSIFERIEQVLYTGVDKDGIKLYIPTKKLNSSYRLKVVGYFRTTPFKGSSRIL